MTSKSNNPTSPKDSFKSNQNFHTDIPHQRNHLHSYLASLLESLEEIEESSKYHPESDALFHSLQVFQCALTDSNDPVLWAAALFHDIGKSFDYANHEAAGSELLSGLLCPRVIWLINHHLDLLKSPQKTRHKLRETRQLKDLELLRRWDLSGRKVDADVISIHEALDHILVYYSVITHPSETYSG